MKLGIVYSEIGNTSHRVIQNFGKSYQSLNLERFYYEMRCGCEFESKCNIKIGDTVACGEISFFLGRKTVAWVV